MEMASVYQNIAARTGGDIYLGVVGPVRTGKSTFIKRFMDLMVIPGIEDPAARSQAVDEMPQSAQGKTIMTTEPKFVPKEAVRIDLEENVPVRVRLIDCVGFLIEGVNGHMEEGNERMVRTPWYDHEIPFAKAAMIGTQKVIREHATIGIVVTTDGSFTDIPRENYIPAEERTVTELKEIGKPFVVLLNTPRPYSEQTDRTVKQMREKYQAPVLPVNCEQMKAEDVRNILQQVLFEFQVMRMDIFVSKWVEMLPDEHPVKMSVIAEIKRLMEHTVQMRDLIGLSWEAKSGDIDSVQFGQIDPALGTVRIQIHIREDLYYDNLSELTGIPIRDEYELISTVKGLAGKKAEYEKVAQALEGVKNTGYGVVMPSAGEISVEEPVLMKHGSKFGVKIRASSPSIHMIRANVETEIAPIIGNEEQAADLISYMKENRNDADGLWKTSVFGKSIGELVEDGIQRKIALMDEESQLKLQDTMQKIVNDSNGGLVCIII